MRRSLLRNLLFVVILTLLVGGGLVASRLVIVHADTQQRMTINAQTVPLVQSAYLLHALDSGKRLELSVGLRLRHKAELQFLLREIADPHSSHYRQYLTSEQFKQAFAPTPQQVQQVVTYLQGQGLTVTSIAANNLLIDATGTVAQVQQCFGVQINTYQLGPRVFFANAQAPDLPASIAPLVVSVGGLDNSAQYHPLYQRLALPPTVSSTPPGLSPHDLISAYDVAPLRNSGVNGQKQSVALLELDGYQESDVKQYFQSYAINHPAITNYMVDNFNGDAGQGSVETTLDIEMIGSIAPSAHILVYEGPGTTQGLNDTYTKIVNDHQANIVSMSWGLCESSTGNAELQTLDAIFAQGAAEGMSFIAGSGDSGAYDCQSRTPAVDSPADDPNVTGVGATTLQLNGGAYGSESVWSNPAQIVRGPLGGGSGGGVSTFFPQPSWQSGPGVQNPYSNGNRELPDVAAFGDAATGFSVYCTVRNAGCPADGWTKLGGTSVAAPFWAASLLLVSQYMQENANSTLGLVNPTLYGLFNANPPYPPFHDVVTGSNLYYPATAGYDLASGMGSPDVYNIARDLAPSSTAATPTPAQLLQNGGFENGITGWQETSKMGYELLDSSNPHSGKNDVFMCGYSGCDDHIAQTFTVPTDYTAITLSYWWYASTSETVDQCVDTFSSFLQDSSQTTLRTLQQSCNATAASTWQHVQFDLTTDLISYKGKAVTLLFHGINGRVQTSAFFIDDVSIAVS